MNERYELVVFFYTYIPVYLSNISLISDSPGEYFMWSKAHVGA